MRQIKCRRLLSDTFKHKRVDFLADVRVRQILSVDCRLQQKIQQRHFLTTANVVIVALNIGQVIIAAEQFFSSRYDDLVREIV